MRESRKYRNDALDGYIYSDLAEYGYDDNKEILIPGSTVKSVIDDIESNVNEIRDLLDDIKGLTEIDEVKDKISSLSQKLY